MDRIDRIVVPFDTDLGGQHTATLATKPLASGVILATDVIFIDGQAPRHASTAAITAAAGLVGKFYPSAAQIVAVFGTAPNN